METNRYTWLFSNKTHVESSHCQSNLGNTDKIGQWGYRFRCWYRYKLQHSFSQICHWDTLWISYRVSNAQLHLSSWNSSLGAGNDFERHLPSFPFPGCLHSTASLILNELILSRHMKPKILRKASQSRRHHNISRNLTSWLLTQGAKKPFFPLLIFHGRLFPVNTKE